MDDRSVERRPVTVFAIVLAILLFGVIGLLTVFLWLSTAVSGTATLPNGLTARINGPFSCVANGDITEIEAGGHVFAFTPTTILIDNITVGPLDSTVTDVQIDVSFRSASLTVNGSEVTLTQ